MECFLPPTTERPRRATQPAERTESKNCVDLSNRWMAWRWRRHGRRRRRRRGVEARRETNVKEAKLLGRMQREIAQRPAWPTGENSQFFPPREKGNDRQKSAENGSPVSARIARPADEEFSARPVRPRWLRSDGLKYLGPRVKQNYDALLCPRRQCDAPLGLRRRSLPPPPSPSPSQPGMRETILAIKESVVL